MALSGTIADWSFADILQVVSAQQKSGTLVVDCGHQRVELVFCEGKIAGVEYYEAGRHSGFVRFLVETGRIAPASARELITLLQEVDDHAMELVAASELVEAERLVDGIEAFVQEIIYRVLHWAEGEYEFTAHTVAAPATHAPIATEGLLIEAMRRIDEWSRITSVVHPETVFCRAPGTHPDTDLSQRDYALFELIDGIQDVRSLRRLAPLTEYELGESLMNLYQAGRLEIANDAATDTQILELALDDLEPVPRFQRVLRAVSLVVLVAASIVFGAVTHGVDWAVSSREIDQSRLQQAVRFSLELYRDERGAYPAELSELDGLGVRLAGADRRLVYRQGPSGHSYTLIDAQAIDPIAMLPDTWSQWLRRQSSP